MRRRIFLTTPLPAGLSIVFIVGIVLVFTGFRPEKTESLNPNHGGCAVCHNLHSAPGQSLTNVAVVETLCLSCHGPAGVATKKAEVHTNKSGSAYPAFTMTCMDCHNPHDNILNRFGGTNLGQVGKKVGTGVAEIDTPNSGKRYVVFQSRGSDAGGLSLYSFADNDEDNDSYYDGVCETCHTLAANHRNDAGGNHAHYTGTNCIICHPHDGNFLGSGGGCTGCHDKDTDNKDGGPTRRAMAGEFGLTSHHVAAGTVTDDDCGVCHFEAVDGNYHQNNMVDLRNPDDGTETTLISFTTFSRNTASDTIEAVVTNVQNNFCLKCHDADGATATHFSGNPMMPFSSGAVNVPDVSGQMDTSNSYHHAVRGAGNNPYCVPSGSNGNNVTMESPWNQDGTHDVISCFDCHETGGHGSGNQRMLRVSIDLDAMEAGTLSVSIGATVETFCTLCHRASVYVNPKADGFSDSKVAGSVMEYHGDAQNQHGASGGNELGCLGCHGGIIDYNGLIPSNGSARGNIHGGNFVWPSGTFSAGDTTAHFMVGGWMSGWNISGTTGQCGGGECNHKGGARKAGKTYTR